MTSHALVSQCKQIEKIGSKILQLIEDARNILQSRWNIEGLFTPLRMVEQNVIFWKNPAWTSEILWLATVQPKSLTGLKDLFSFAQPGLESFPLSLLLWFYQKWKRFCFHHFERSPWLTHSSSFSLGIHSLKIN